MSNFSTFTDTAKIGSFSYIDKDATVPSNYLGFTSNTTLVESSYPELAAVIPAVQPLNLAATIDSGTDNTSSGFASSTGQGIAISGNYAILGRGSQNNALIYFYNGTAWSLQQTISNPSGQSGVAFGTAVDISGDYAVIGSRDTVSSQGNAGSVSVYLRSGSTWSLQQTINNPNPGTDVFGDSVSIDETFTYLAVGARLDSTAGGNFGSVYIYLRSGTTWSLQQTISGSGGASGLLFGYLVDITSTTLAVRNQNNNTFIYTRSGTTWSLQQTIDNFGSTIGHMSLVGDYLGLANRIYFRSGSTWSLQTTVSGDNIAITDTYAYSISGTTLYFYTRSGATWTLTATITAPASLSTTKTSGTRVLVAGSTNKVLYFYHQEANFGIFLYPLPASAEHKTLVRLK